MLLADNARVSNPVNVYRFSYVKAHSAKGNEPIDPKIKEEFTEAAAGLVARRPLFLARSAAYRTLFCISRRAIRSNASISARDNLSHTFSTMDSGNSEAIRLAQASDWKGLQRLLERDPAVAKQRGDHGMLPIHWACTVSRVPLSLMAKLIQAYPDGVRAKNAGELLPLHIAIRAGVQASCLRKLLRAYPEAVSEQTPDGVSALKMAEEFELDADSLKLLRRAHDRNSLQQQQDESPSERESTEIDFKQALGAQEEGEASGLEKPEEEETEEWTEAVVPEPYVGNVGFNGFLHVGDDGELETTETPVLEPENSFNMMSEQSLSIDGLDSPHDHLVSPSSESSSSLDDPPSSRSSFGAAFRTSSRRGLSGIPSQNQTPGRPQTRMHRATSLLTQLQTNGIVTERELRTMVSAMSASAAVANPENEMSSRSHSRHLSLPLMPSNENFRRSPSFHFYGEVNGENEENEIEIASSRDSASTVGGVQFNPGGRLFQSVHEPIRRSVTPSGTQRSSPPLFRRTHRRASHSSHGRSHFDPPPEWKHDGECSICRASFGMFKHRHHCRNCGKSICSQHSADKKISMEAKGFTTPQRVCVTCYAMITHSRALKHDLELEEMGHEGPGIFQQLPNASAGSNDRHHFAGTVFSSSGAPGFSRGGFGSSRSPTSTGGSPTNSPTTGRKGSSRKSTVLAAGEATGGAGERATTPSPVHELRCLLASQQKQIEQLAQSNMQMQQQLLEQEELKAETMLLITQLMTRVSVLELQKERSFHNSKRRSAETGESEDDDEEFPQDDTLPFER
ncbi:FYVE zinc finger domain-containing protein [Phytophthora infestans]|uniref:FYVE zinc finger domain-containing protein n=1 Tax=Phytophthora infestans TaxID=4787 RepID=A0A833TER8_PHYIN|nr:FYVE zinc finger domain-containing protein [Phytophthora infestans]